MFVAEALVHRYRGRGHDLLHGLSYRARPGQLIGVEGPNGSGKTTLLNILGGRLQPKAGQVLWQGLVRGSRAFRRRVVCLTQDPQLDPELTGTETVRLFSVLWGGTPSLSLLGDELQAMVGGYSGGMKRRLHLMLASIGRPELICLDEPEAGLDRGGREQLWAWLRGHAATVVLASHRLPQCDDIIELRR